MNVVKAWMRWGREAFMGGVELQGNDLHGWRLEFAGF
jgi:hypothetical protein